MASYTQEVSRLNAELRTVLFRMGYPRTKVDTIVGYVTSRNSIDGCSSVRPADRRVIGQLLRRHAVLAAPETDGPTEADRRWWVGQSEAEVLQAVTADQAVTEAAFHAACCQVAEEWGQWD
jgi:hypothetical protein